jgi:hypothetical protein
VASTVGCFPDELQGACCRGPAFDSAGCTVARIAHGKDIVVAGIVIVGPESMFMAMPTASPSSEQEAMWVQMSSAVARKPGRIETEYLRQQKAGGLITAILRGRFEGSDRRAFGHQICCRFKLEITKVLSIG